MKLIVTIDDAENEMIYLQAAISGSPLSSFSLLSKLLIKSTIPASPTSGYLYVPFKFVLVLSTPRYITATKHIDKNNKKIVIFVKFQRFDDILTSISSK